MTDSLQRMRELAIQSANGSISDTERAYLDLEYRQLVQEIDRVSEATQFGDVQLLNGGANPGDRKFFDFQIGQGTTMILYFFSSMTSIKTELGQGKNADGTDDTCKPPVGSTVISRFQGGAQFQLIVLIVL